MAATYPQAKRFHFVDDVSDQEQALLECFGVRVGHTHVELPPQSVIVSELLDCPCNGDITTIYEIAGITLYIADKVAYSTLSITRLPFLLNRTISENDRLSDICYLELKDEARAHGIIPESDYVDDYVPDDCDPLQWSEELES